MKNYLAFILFFVINCTNFAQETLQLQIKVNNKNGETIVIRNNQQILQEIKLDDKNQATANFSVQEGMYFLFDGKEYAQLYLKNGFSLSVTFDGQDFDNSIKFEGNGAKENNFLAKQALGDKAYNYDALLAADVATFKKNFEEKKKSEIAAIESAGLSENFVSQYKNSLMANNKGLEQYYYKMSENRKFNNTQSPNFDYENHAGGKMTLESMRGKYVYIDVWATWCGPCRAEIPHLKNLEESFHGRKIEFVSISVDTKKDYEKWRAFVTEKQLGGIQLLADKDWSSDFIKHYGINSIPRFILIDPTGKVVDADAKRPSNPALAEQLNGLLKIN
jgi:thiol-disulfide isomerase/thioredoxin